MGVDEKGGFEACDRRDWLGCCQGSFGPQLWAGGAGGDVEKDSFLAGQPMAQYAPDILRSADTRKRLIASRFRLRDSLRTLPDGRSYVVYFAYFFLLRSAVHLLIMWAEAIESRSANSHGPALLRLILSREQHDALVGDLDERTLLITNSQGIEAANAWRWRQLSDCSGTLIRVLWSTIVAALKRIGCDR
jgi:hypothetical protein